MSTHAFNEILKKMKKKYGDDVILKANEAVGLGIPRIPTGIFVMDWACSAGIPIGRVSMFFGHEGSAKTTVALRVIASAQRMCRKCFKYECDCKDREGFKVVFLDAEGAYSTAWAEKIGVQNDKLLIVRPEFFEQAIDIGDALLRSGECDLLIFDSVAGLAPLGEISSTSEDWQMGLAARLMNKCCAGSDWVIDYETGEKILIRDLVKNRRKCKVVSCDENGNMVLADVVDWFENGEKEVYDVRTSLGTVRLTGDHLVMTDKGWKEVKNLSSWDYMVAPDSLQVEGKEVLSDDEIRSLAYMIGDGGCSCETFSFTNKDPFVIEEMKKCLATFDCKLHCRDKNRCYSYSVVRKGKPNLGSKRNKFKTFVKKMGLYGSKSPTKFVPKEVMFASLRQVKLFISRLWATDGYVSPAHLIYVSTSERLANQVRLLLLRLGIPAELYQQENKEGFHTSYRVEICGEARVIEAEEKIGFIGEKKRIPRRKTGRRFSASRWEELPDSRIEFFKKICEENGLLGKDVSKILFLKRHAFPSFERGSKKFTKRIVREVYDKIKDERLLELIVSDKAWARVLGVDWVGKEDVYDVTTKGNLVLNGLIVHNCIRKWVGSLNSYGLSSIQRPTILLINQVRSKIGMYGAGGTTLPSGRGQRFATSLEVQFMRGQYSEDKNPKKMKVRFLVKKNKVGPPLRQGSFDLYVRKADGYSPGEVDDRRVVFNFANKYGVIKKKDDRTWEYNGDTFPTKTSIREKVMGDEKEFNKLKANVFEVMENKEEIYEEDE